MNLHAPNSKRNGCYHPKGNDNTAAAIRGRPLRQVEDAERRSSIYLIIYSSLGMKYAHASLAITRDDGSFDGTCSTTFRPCA